MQASKQAIQDWLIERIAQLANLPRSEVDPKHQFSDFGLDSLVLTGLCFDLEIWLDRSIDEGIIWEYQDIDALAGYLASGSGGLGQAP